MALERLRVAWDHTAAVQATIINCHKGSDDRAVSPYELHPYREDEAPEATRGDVIRLPQDEQFALLKRHFT